MNLLKPLEGLPLSSNMAESETRFLQYLQFVEAMSSALAVWADKQKVAVLPHMAEPEAVDVVNTFTLSND